MERIFITGGTGFLGSYVIDDLLASHPDADLWLLTRAADQAAFEDKMWRAMQLHWTPERFRDALPRLRFLSGDLHAPGLGLSDADRQAVTSSVDSVLHIAASLNRKSAKACLNTNLRGTLSVLKLARAIADDHGLRRYSHVSTVAVAGHRDSEVVQEDAAVDWDRSDYDPYGRTKKFCEHMAAELLPDVQTTIFRPSAVMGDSRFAQTTQFDMVRAFCNLADLPLIPLRDDIRVDIVNADWVGHAIAALHMKPDPAHRIYHLSAGESAQTSGEIARALAAARGKEIRFAPALERPFSRLVDTVAASSAKNTATLVASLMKVFLPYITYDTVFDNRRAVSELGRAPVPFTTYCAPLYRFAKQHGFDYPYAPLPPAAAAEEAAA